MPDCTTCEHSNLLHADSGGPCSVDGCACDQLMLEEVTPDIPPPKPGACLHLIQDGTVWTIEELAEVEEKIDDSSDNSFIEVTACDFEDVKGQSRKQFCTYPARIRPAAITSYHEMPELRWQKILDAI